MPVPWESTGSKFTRASALFFFFGFFFPNSAVRKSGIERRRSATDEADATRYAPRRPWPPWKKKETNALLIFFQVFFPYFALPHCLACSLFLIKSFFFIRKSALFWNAMFFFLWWSRQLLAFASVFFFVFFSVFCKNDSSSVQHDSYLNIIKLNFKRDLFFFLFNCLDL